MFFNDALAETSSMGSNNSSSIEMYSNASTNIDDHSNYCPMAPDCIHDRCFYMSYFSNWSQSEQIHFVQHLLTNMSQHQLERVNGYLQPLLQRDFISLLPIHLSQQILSYLDPNSLSMADQVCRKWSWVIVDGRLWRRRLEKKVRTCSLWQGLAERNGSLKYLLYPRYGDCEKEHHFFKQIYFQVLAEIKVLENNWRTGQHKVQRINCQSEMSKGVYCLQYDNKKIVSGMRDNSIKIWDRKSLECIKSLEGHTGSVLCLQYNDRIIMSGSSDATIRVWDIVTGELLNTLNQHKEAVLHLQFDNNMLVTCSKDRFVSVWDVKSPTDIVIRRLLFGHRGAVNVVEFDSKYIVSASGDRTIKVWSASTCDHVRTLSGHRRGIACLQYKHDLIISGSSDNTIRMWDVESGFCLRVLTGHDELVRCIRFDKRRIISGAYDGKIKVWDLKAALDANSTSADICIATLQQHSSRVFRLQFDEFQIMSSSHDDSIVIFDFSTVLRQLE